MSQQAAVELRRELPDYEEDASVAFKIHLLYTGGMVDERDDPWLLFMPQIPLKPSYFRVKVWRRLQALGAVAIKNSVYVLPNGESTREDFGWMRREILKDGGEAMLCEARLIEGLSDAEVQASFQAVRDTDYRAIAESARTLTAQLPRGVVADDQRSQFEGEIGRLRRKLTEVSKIDFFGAAGREAAEGLVSGLESRLHSAAVKSQKADHTASASDFQGRVWVTRTGVFIDRIASAWLIRRFVDPNARFKFVSAKGYAPAAKQVRFDMFDAEFTHEGDKCTFEVLIARFGLADRALVPIAEIVHDLDLKDAKFQRPEAPGVDRLIAGIAMANKDDEDRIAHGSTVLDGLYESYRRKRP